MFGGGGEGERQPKVVAKDNLAVGRPALAVSAPITPTTATSTTVTPAKTAQSPTSAQKMELELPDIPSDAKVTETTVRYFSTLVPEMPQMIGSLAVAESSRDVMGRRETCLV